MSGNSVKHNPGYADVAHPEIFNTMPPQPQQLKTGQLSEAQVKKFFTEGFLLVDSLFAPEDLEPCKDTINESVDELAKALFKAGKIKNLYEDYGFDKRLTMVEKEYPGANIILHKMGELPKAVQDIWSDERLLNIAEQILGTSDIIGHPVWNLRTKTPNSEATTVPWHQDAAYLDNRSYDVLQLTAWIPLMDATEETGCMQVVRGGHKTGRVATHTGCAGDTWYITLSDNELRNTLECNLDEDIVTVPVNFGSVLFLNNLVPHRSLNNFSERMRWSFDLRWQTADRNPGFYDIKDGVRMRSSSDPSFKINWDQFANVSRFKKFDQDDDLFNTTVTGPWMLKWEITNPNRHTEALKKTSITSGHMILG